MKKYRIQISLLLVLMIFLFIGCVQQEKPLKVTGKVLDAESGLVIPGCSVRIQMTREGTITDEDGNYSIQVIKGAYLFYSCEGYEADEVVVTQEKINMHLHPEKYIYFEF